MLSELSADLGALDATARDAYTTIYAGDATLSMEIGRPVRGGSSAGHRIHWNVDDGRARVYDGEFDDVALRPEVRDKKSATRALERIASAEFDDLRRIILEFANPHAVTMAKYANFEQYAEEAGL